MENVRRFNYRGAAVSIGRDEWGYLIDIDDGEAFVDDERYLSEGAAVVEAHELIERRSRERFYRTAHVCNYGSRWRAALCSVVVRDGERYCGRHRRAS